MPRYSVRSRVTAAHAAWPVLPFADKAGKGPPCRRPRDSPCPERVMLIVSGKDRETDRKAGSQVWISSGKVSPVLYVRYTQILITRESRKHEEYGDRHWFGSLTLVR